MTKEALANGSVLDLGSRINRMIPENWLDTIGSARRIGESLFEALEERAPGLSISFLEHLRGTMSVDLPQLMAELYHNGQIAKTPVDQPERQQEKLEGAGW